MKKIFYLDLLERVLWTFVQAFLGVWLATGGLSGNVLQAALYAGLIAVAKAVLATQVGDKDSAATLPSPPDHA